MHRSGGYSYTHHIGDSRSSRKSSFCDPNILCNQALSLGRRVSAMDLNKMVQQQRDFDAKHGWIPAEHDTEAVFHTLQEDLIGLFGEVGEFANIIKKITLEKA